MSDKDFLKSQVDLLEREVASRREQVSWSSMGRGVDQAVYTGALHDSQHRLASLKSELMLADINDRRKK